MIDPDHVLVPTLGRPNEDKALAYALETFPDAAVTLLTVVTPLDAPLSEGGVLERDEKRTRRARRHSNDLLESIDTPARERVHLETVEGRPGTVVPKYASAENVDHVVMYGHGVETSSFMRRFHPF
ncbi:universal stress protein [Natronobacterium gregoryi]|uniref:Universal stress protein n=2 Tax=Natronobacterium gregoryi TaxID=44930 RepID=L0AH20_NATGS|nr:universal stress protein [Natronobacterium gregoryi]AFZ72719.1 universal stress protein UspA-like protein [Natronobacterium gregoryi SP2]ELY69227.1 UspA domain-containing protein [Natronobacterium gregoryi SP2]PLK18441.1 universal stress protein [Natronobacterium gregoryi SP2]SFJ70769.1 Nucleotide-binding universal stress protein, UspA family [Natronobacterium gregoryi]